ncbi:hypothetical protein BOX37_07990 [Nocardia mangyaensis]|uniref:DUF732 domain-containing protein n=1 Tax=Nocardia mangyaensis TaxID=2213200 RepID=A0A1J0VPF4_9NOCA|nr:hypothetical protein [Nocardia mangyaensis]APE33920.1 hypothetical protein BOX37_07990 [Nocardia mangyaensis]
MPHRRWKFRPALLIAGALAVASLTACGSGEAVPTGSSGTTTSAAGSAAKTTGPAGAGEAVITDAAAAELCGMIEPELSNFRVQGPTLGRFSLNAMVHEWALRNGGINGQVLADKAIVDRVTTGACPDVRTEALTSLELPDLASGLAF